MPDHDPHRGRADGPSRFDELAVFQREHLTANEPGEADPVHDRERHEDEEEPVHGRPELRPAERRDDDDHEEEIGERVDDVGEAHEEVVDPTADVARDHADARSDDEDHRDGDESDDEAHARPVHEPGQDVPAKFVRAEEIAGVGELATEPPRPDGLHELLRGVLLDRGVRGDDRGEDRDERGEDDHREPGDRRPVAKEAPYRVAPERTLLAGGQIVLGGLSAGADRRRRHQLTLIRGSSAPYTMSTVMFAIMITKA